MCDVYMLVSVFSIDKSNFFSVKISVTSNLNKLSATVKSLLIACLFFLLLARLQLELPAAKLH